MQLFDRVMQFCRQLNAGSPTTHDGNIHALLLFRIGRELEEQVQHLVMETVRLIRVIQEDAVISYPWGAKVVRGAAERHHQDVVAQLAGGNQLAALLIADLR
ncbi:hypothetical protein D3C78_1755060 [compost metagenome]